jgi:hypothetical protein
MRVGRLVAAAALAVALSSCGGSGGSGSSADPGLGPAPPKVPSVTQFPKVRGRTIAQLAAAAQAGPVLAQSVSLLTPGKARFGFGLFDRSRKQITEAPGALYIGRSPGSRASGPFVARWESLTVQGHYLSKTVATDPDAAHTLYVADLPFKKPGKYVILGLFRLDNRLVGAGTTIKVVKGSNVPTVGSAAPMMHTPTKASVGGDLAKIDTRDPHDDMHDVDYAAALGKRPIVLVFATPALCQSRVCGPVVDIAEQVRHARPSDDVAWIHMEIFNNNKLNDGYRPQFLKYHLPGEPWLFTINRRGKVAARIEGAFSASELQKAVDAATKG